MGCEHSKPPIAGDDDAKPLTDQPMTEPESYIPDHPDRKTESEASLRAEGDARYINMTLDEAKALAIAEKKRWRVVSEDGEIRMVTKDFRPERLNFTLVEGRITKVTRG